MTILFLLFLFCESAILWQSCGSDETKEFTELAKNVDDRPLVFATLGGGMVAVDHITGQIKWKLSDEPVVKVPNQDNDLIPQLLPDPRHGSLYMYGPVGNDKHVLKKLPFTIPELVANAPCRSSDGILYTGRKIDTWFKINPDTGLRQHVSGFDGANLWENEDTCTLDKTKAVYLARTEYNILMHTSSNNRKWNVTFFDYNAHAMGRDVINDYGLIHFTSASNGRVMSFDRKSGDLKWSRDLDTPVVAAYILDRDGLISVPFNPIGDNTMDHIMQDARSLTNNHGLKNSNMELFPTLYIGEHNHGLYALTSLVDKDTMTISTELQLPLLLEGPQNFVESQYNPQDNYQFIVKDLDLSQHLNRPYLILGHYKLPEVLSSWPLHSNKLQPGIAMHRPTEIKLINGLVQRVIDGKVESDLNDSEKHSDVMSIGGHTDDEDQPYPLPMRLDVLYKQGYLWLHQQENKGLKMAFIILVGFVIFMFYYLQHQMREVQQLSQGGSNTSSNRSSGRNGAVTAQLVEMGDGEMKIGKITFNLDHVLGKGCEGTFVFKGTFDKREVAVKRLLPECFNFADREVALLRESDAHAHVVRYFCTEQDKQFRYIALELCGATLKDFVEDKLEFSCKISCVELLRQATSGLAHLHSMDIVHRDIKPHNVLLSLPSKTGEIRAMISDFGLCKKLNIGRASFSRRSGVTGTDGWIAPEMMNSERTTASVDIFSLGCVFFYVLSKGKHPFGDTFRRQANILAGDFDLDPLYSVIPEEDLLIVKILIRAMISPNPYKRPSSEAILKNPIFWNKRIALSFLQDVSDVTEAGKVQSDALERGACVIVRGDWRAHVCNHVAADLRTRRTYRGTAVADLLRALRNKKNHYLELSPDVQESLGRVPEGFVNYWLGRFPLLLSHVWICMQPYRSQDLISQYYSHHHTYEWHEVPEFGVEYVGDLTLDNCDPEKNKLFTQSKKFIGDKPERRFKRWNRDYSKKLKRVSQNENVIRNFSCEGEMELTDLGNNL